ncbi:MAG: phage tail protein [Oscillospiraceae bacterium]|nr:phage tail protein [Oscillospiraceae bacterium]
MVIGSLGDVAFYVEPDKIKTIRRMSWNSSAKYSSHDRHMNRPKREFTGLDDDAIQFRMRLSAFLGVNPMDDIRKLFHYERSGTTLPLVVGTRAWGKFRWVILSQNRDIEQFDREGDLLAVDLNISLGAYT